MYPFQSAPDLIASTLRQAEAPTILFVSGPFTNLAQALRLDPQDFFDHDPVSWVLKNDGMAWFK